MTECVNCGREHHRDSTLCFRCHVKGLSFQLRGPAMTSDFHRTANDYRLENFGTADEKELAKRGIERAQ